MRQCDSTSSRLNREEWLEEALKAVSQEPDSPITIGALCERLGVSRGSFYWHFANREDFLVAIIEHWEQRATSAVIDSVLSIDASPEERLSKLIEVIVTYRYSKFEQPMRHWAMKEAKTRKVLQRADKTRYMHVRGLFKEMGFTGDDLDMRVQTCVIYYSFMDALTTPIGKTKTKSAVLRQNKLRHEMLTGLCADAPKGK